MYSVHCTVNGQWPVEYKGLFSGIFFRPSFANFFIKVTFKIFFLIVEIYDFLLFLLFLTFIFYSYFKLPNKTSSKTFSLKFFNVNPSKRPSLPIYLSVHFTNYESAVDFEYVRNAANFVWQVSRYCRLNTS